MTNCPKCGALLPADEIDTSLGLAHCQACGEISELPPSPPAATEPEPVDHWEPDTPAPPSRSQVPSLPPPRGWRSLPGPHLSLARGWMTPQAIFLLLFAAIWDGGLTLAVLSGNTGLLCTPHAWVGVALLYYGIASLVNTTELHLDRMELRLTHGPLPWWGNKTLDVRDIEQIYVKTSSVRVNKQPRWNLLARTRDGKEKVLIRLLSDTAEAHWLEQTLEDRLKIEDEPVMGEVEKF